MNFRWSQVAGPTIPLLAPIQRPCTFQARRLTEFHLQQRGTHFSLQEKHIASLAEVKWRWMPCQEICYSEATVSVYVAPSPIEVRIVGGDRIISASDADQLEMHAVVQDPDDPNLASVTVHWFCSVVGTPEPEGCFYVSLPSQPFAAGTTVRPFDLPNVDDGNGKAIAPTGSYLFTAKAFDSTRVKYSEAVVTWASEEVLDVAIATHQAS